MPSPPQSVSPNHELVERVATRGFLMGLSLFIVLAVCVSMRLTDGFDHSLVREWNPDNSLGSRQEAARDITTLGGYTFLTIFVTIFCFSMKASGRAATMWFVIFTMLNGYVCQSLLKKVFDRPRPEGVLHLSYVESASFPSGHAMMSVIAFLTVGLLLAELPARRKHACYLIALPAILSGMVGISRVYLGVHFPTDVIAGWSAGLCWSCGAWLIARRLETKQITPPILLARRGTADSA